MVMTLLMVVAASLAAATRIQAPLDNIYLVSNRACNVVFCVDFAASRIFLLPSSRHGVLSCLSLPFSPLTYPVP